jgi:hypothetical protein
MTLLLNGYPFKFIIYHFKKCFQQYNASVLLEQLDNGICPVLHQTLLNQPSRREHEQQNHQSQAVNKRTIIAHNTFKHGPMSKFKKELHYLWKKILHL